MQKAKRALCSF